MKNYDEMSNLEIAARVLMARNIPHMIEHQTCFIDEGFEDGASVYTKFDPCTNPRDAWGIISDCGISLVWFPDIEIWEAHWLNPDLDFDEDCHSQDEDGLRAAMICFLKMKDAENGN